ncbi:S66 peptidase family protein [Candidatus Chrysopegis kryptomonas]|uniref:Muramoyltetrapeptide carboxypeptidase n=1 Tax=Candidatus Chryseopegocella kryptomonas TaxID=1633643 RepID=A0A0P1NZT9_9BACT|nr:LD-carboxypeptidase [Candidatus Chrysopegis kryptomonas]CUT03826.1 muramoyltetrapeptide carboxypeptidase [Candidatus Chrysopegis kryptomonas]
MNLKPQALKKGDVIGIISPASSPDDFSRIEKGISYLESLGYKVKLGKHIYKRFGYLSATDDERAEDLNKMFADREIRAIFCVRGGYGTPRILDKIDYNIIKRNPKIFVGYSDITALQLAIFKKTGLITFSGPMLAVDMYSDFDPYAEEFFWKILTAKSKKIEIKNPDGVELIVLRHGVATGTLLGGNLSLLASIIGTRFQPNFKDSILVIEDIGEEPYRIDRYLSQLKNAGILNRINGCIIGQFTDCVAKEPEKSLTLEQIFNDYFGSLKIPVVSNLSYGHIPRKITLPIGANVKIDTKRKSITIIEKILS